MEDVVTNVNDVNDLRTQSLFGIFGKKRYESRYMKRFYNPLKETISSWQEMLIKPDKK
jgi:hypothetical protein